MVSRFPGVWSPLKARVLSVLFTGAATPQEVIMTRLSRRQLIHQSLAAATAAAGLPLSEAALAQAAAAEAGWRWDKGVCCICGTGCGIQVATQDGRVVATKGGARMCR